MKNKIKSYYGGFSFNIRAIIMGRYFLELNMLINKKRRNMSKYVEEYS